MSFTLERERERDIVLITRRLGGRAGATVTWQNFSVTCAASVTAV